MKIRELMSTPARSVKTTDELDVGIGLMDAHGLRHLPVIAGAQVVGVVSDRDLLEATGWIGAARRRARRVVEGKALPTLRHMWEVMHSPAVTIGPEETIFTAAVQFTVEKIGCLPVLEDGELVGMVTPMDLLGAFEQACADHEHPCDDPHVAGPMTSPPLSVEWDCTLEEAARTCHEADIRHLIVFEGERLVGIVSDRDLRRAHGRGSSGETIVQELMTADPVSISPDEHLHEAARLMREHNIGALPVIADDVLVGMVSSTDLVYHCMQHLAVPASGA